jgi:hypothetical protein
MITYFENCKKTTQKPTIPIKKRFLALAFLGFAMSTPFQLHAGNIINYSKLVRTLNRNASFQQYLDMPLRQKLTAAENNNLSAIDSTDASNWTSCQVGKGTLAGTARDISGCAAAIYFQKEVTAEDMAKLSYDDASNIIRSIWDHIKASAIPDQDVANLVMHIQMHYGNIRIVQKGLNQMGNKLRLSGRMDKATLNALVVSSFWKPSATYIQIRLALKSEYQKSPYRRAFLRALKREFPEKIDYIALAFVAIKDWQQKLTTQTQQIASCIKDLAWDDAA